MGEHRNSVVFCAHDPPLLLFSVSALLFCQKFIIITRSEGPGKRTNATPADAVARPDAAVPEPDADLAAWPVLDVAAVHRRCWDAGGVAAVAPAVDDASPLRHVAVDVVAAGRAMVGRSSRGTPVLGTMG